ncbi:D-alanyl-D-alanine carboxypeptidase [Saccharomonospora cyanea]|uniref:D-alanyl-D-alanine carboxypeptidase n=1 Tax=Saccharomonospora cyanea NA-134 TaxID=882082 RepID=H5XHV4_9PSEU|nr:D-alanyl-D-alanine carboxypeptidase [Saccharomonospora cyanea]EHR59560.1 D-alanyl-D-alanine carboxypeptidase [Saccharomonospora cyanea NA-134]
MRSTTRIRTVLVVLVTAALTALTTFVATPPSEALAKQPSTACPNRTLPPSPVDTSEKPPPGEASPAPLPVPESPAGGPRMAECGLVLPPGSPEPPQDITAAAWLVQDLATGEVLAAKDPHGRHRPASLIKTLLAVVALEELRPDHVVVATEADADQECTCVGIVAGGEYRVDELVDALLMRSGNDVAHTLATALGGVDAAVEKMNRLAEWLGAADTRAATPSGLDGPGMMTSAYDMSLVFRHAMQQSDYAEAVGTKEIRFPGGPGEPDFPVYNDNPLWATYEGFLGGKTGFTDDSRHTYAGAAERDGRRLAVVLLRAEQQPVRVAEQAARLLDYGFTLAASGSESVGTVTSSPLDSPGDGTGEELASAGVASTTPEDPFGTTGWIVTLAVTLAVIAGLLMGHRKGLLRRPD